MIIASTMRGHNLDLVEGYTAHCSARAGKVRLEVAYIGGLHYSSSCDEVLNLYEHGVSPQLKAHSK